METTAPGKEYESIELAMSFGPEVSRPSISVHQTLRPRMISLFEALESVPLILVVAPAGFGKTRVLAEWASKPGRLVSWLRADERGNDPAVFAQQLIESVRRSSPEAIQGMIDPAGAGSPSPGSLRQLVDAVTDSGQPLVTVIDDFHLLTEPAVMELCSLVIDRSPSSWRWIISSRTEPPLGLGRRRADMTLSEIVADDLRFDDSEAYKLIHDGIGVDISPGAARIINRRTRGWAVGLTLAALAASSSQSPDDALRGYTGEDRNLDQYLTEEVFASIPESLQDFLLRSSVLHYLGPDVCSAVTQYSDADQLLSEATARGLFLSPVAEQDSDVFELHDLFAEWLRFELGRRSPGLAEELRKRASRWCADRGLFIEAIDYALEARDWDRSAQLIEAHGYKLYQRGFFRTVHSWMGNLPEDMRGRSHTLMGLSGDAAVQAGDWQRVRKVTSLALDADQSTSSGRAARLGGIQLSWLGTLATGTLEEMKRVTADMEKLLARDTAPPEPSHLGEDHRRAAIFASITRYFEGDLVGSLTRLEQAKALPDSVISSVTAEGLEALIRYEMGEEEEALRLARGALDQIGYFDTPAIGALLAALALVWVGDQDEFDVARSVAEEVIQGARLPQGPTLLALFEAESAVRAGKQGQAEHAMEVAGARMSELTETRLVERFIEMQAQRVSPRDAPQVEDLTGREEQILRLLPTGLTRREIARELGVSMETVKTHTSKLYRKLGVNSRAEAVELTRESRQT